MGGGDGTPRRESGGGNSPLEMEAASDGSGKDRESSKLGMHARTGGGEADPRESIDVEAGGAPNLDVVRHTVKSVADSCGCCIIQAQMLYYTS